MSELYRKLGFSMPIAKTAEMANKYHGFLRDGHVTELDEKAAIIEALAIHRSVITSDCVQRKKRYDLEEQEAQRWLSGFAADRRPRSFHFDPYMLTNSDSENKILEEYLESIQADHVALSSPAEDHGDQEDEEAGQPIIDIPKREAPKGRRGRPPKGKPKAERPSLPLAEDLINKWGACDAYMFQVLIDEERHGIDYAERHYDTYERIERMQRDTEFIAALLPPSENAFSGAAFARWASSASAPTTSPWGSRSRTSATSSTRSPQARTFTTSPTSSTGPLITPTGGSWGAWSTARSTA